MIYQRTKSKISLLSAVLAVVLALLGTSCIDNIDIPVDGNAPIAFAPAVDFEATKALNVDASTLSSFTVEAFVAGSTSDPYIHAETYVAAGNPKAYNSSTPHYWPASTALDFYAYSAGTAEGQLVKTDYRTFTVKPAALPAAQMDFVYACSKGQTKAGSSGGATPLNFRHAMSKVSVKVKNTNPDLKFQVTGWRVGYLDERAVFTHNATSTAGSGALAASCWSENASPASSITYTSDFTASAVNVAAGASTPVALSGDMVLIPQTTAALSRYASASSGAAAVGSYVAVEIKVMANDAGSTVIADKTWAAWPVAVSWAPGMQYTYTVDLSGGGYYTTNHDSDIDLDAILEGARIAFVDIAVTAWGTQSVSAVDLPEGVSDLSYMDYAGAGTMRRNTANCYIVHSPGRYKFPLVYGNGIKDGAVNAAAYTSGGGAYQADFVNHLGNTLTSPYIESNGGCTASSAGLIWQTAPSMITDVRLDAGSPCRFVSFDVTEVPATNGDAVLAVYDGSGNVMWSWMVWVTADDLSPVTVTNHDSENYDLMPENLGAIWNGASRNVASGARCVNPYYQWGRKDPMAPQARYDGWDDIALYDVSGSVYTGYGTYGVLEDSDASGTERSIANSIRLPQKFFLAYDASKVSWNNLSDCDNLWNAAAGTVSPRVMPSSNVKTIYDPCPAGWMVTPGNVFSGFTKTGRGVASISDANVIGSFASGFYFQRSSSDATGTYFPASAYRIGRSGGFNLVNTVGYYWLNWTESTTAVFLYFGSSQGVYPSYSEHKSYGMSVRPCREQ